MAEGVPGCASPGCAARHTGITLQTGHCDFQTTGGSDLVNFRIIELAGDIRQLPAARWMKSHAPNAQIAASCTNIPSVHPAVKSAAELAPLPAVYAAEDRGLIKAIGAIPELDYPLFLFTHSRSRFGCEAHPALGEGSGIG